MPDPHELTEMNRRAWNEIAIVRDRTRRPAEFFAAGGNTLDAPVLQAAGDVRGLSVLHLQCATGDDTLSWAVLGARATGVDISDAQVALAQAKADAAQLEARFISADVLALPGELARGDFDLVFTGGGALVWLPDLHVWAVAVAAALRPGGRLILFEEHPVAACLWLRDGQLHIVSDYFGRGQPEYGQGWSHFEGGEDARETSAEFTWPLGDIVTALVRAGLHIESLEEYPVSEAASYRFGPSSENLRRLPGSFLLVARKPAP